MCVVFDDILFQRLHMPTSLIVFECRIVQGHPWENNRGGGGGGAGAAASGIDGGAGVQINFDGNLRFFAGGGGGALGTGTQTPRGGVGGSQIGGTGSRNNGRISGIPAIANTGSGGGGSSDHDHGAVFGSAGLIMVRWPIF